MLTVMILALFFGLLGFGFGLAALIKVLAAERATHTVHMQPIADPTGSDSDLSELAAAQFAATMPVDDDAGFDMSTKDLEKYLLGENK